MPELTLYYFDGCPFCGRVRQFMEQEGITVNMKDIHETSENREELIEIGGKAQVPCLVIDGKALYESNDIIQWLKDNYKES